MDNQKKNFNFSSLSIKRNILKPIDTTFSKNIQSTRNKKLSFIKPLIIKKNDSNIRVKLFNLHKSKNSLSNSSKISKTSEQPNINNSLNDTAISNVIKSKANQVQTPKKEKEKYVKIKSLYSLPSLSLRRSKENSKIIKPSNLPENQIFDYHYKVQGFRTNRNKNKYESIENNFNKILYKLYNKKIIPSFDNCKKKVIKIPKFVKKEVEKKKMDRYEKIDNFMKFKYYDDVSEKIERKLKGGKHLDLEVKDKIIKIGSVSIFWKSIFDFCSPLVYAEKYRGIKKNNEYNLGGSGMNTKNRKKILHQKLYTNIFATNLIHYRNKKENNSNI